MHRVLTYFGSIFNEIIIKILGVGTWYELFGFNCQKKKKKKSTGSFRLYFSCFEPFWVWGVIVMVSELAYDSVDFEDRNWFWLKSEH